MGVYKGGKRQPQHRKDGCSASVPMALLMMPWALWRLAADTRKERRR